MLFSIQHKLKSILEISNKVERELALRSLAQNLGCSLGSTYDLQTGKLFEEELVRRIQEAMREERDARLWWVAVIAAIASAISALTALIAVYK